MSWVSQSWGRKCINQPSGLLIAFFFLWHFSFSSTKFLLFFFWVYPSIVSYLFHGLALSLYKERSFHFSLSLFYGFSHLRTDLKLSISSLSWWNLLFSLATWSNTWWNIFIALTWIPDHGRACLPPQFIKAAWKKSRYLLKWIVQSTVGPWSCTPTSGVSFLLKSLQWLVALIWSWGCYAWMAVWWAAW